MRQHRNQRSSEHAHCRSAVSQSHRYSYHFTFSVHLQVMHIQKYGDKRTHTETQAPCKLNAIMKSALITCCHTDMCYKYPHATQSGWLVYPQAAAPHNHPTVPGMLGVCTAVWAKENEEKCCFKLCVWTTERGADMLRQEAAPENVFMFNIVSWCSPTPMSQSITNAAPPSGQSEQLSKHLKECEWQHNGKQLWCCLSSPEYLVIFASCILKCGSDRPEPKVA